MISFNPSTPLRRRFRRSSDASARLPARSLDTVDLAHSAIVVAHPDDEVLWFSSLTAKVARIVLCYGAISPASPRAAGRRRVVAAYPLDTVCFLDLAIPAAAAADDAVHRRRLADRLAEPLAGMTTVFTHNPWGEYGQADHRRVHLAVDALSVEAGFAVYISSYAARHQLGDVGRALSRGAADVISAPTSPADIDRMVALYKSHACWTWAAKWRWPEREHFLRLAADAAEHRGAEFPIHLFGSRVKRRAEMRGLWVTLFGAKTKELVLPCGSPPA